MIDDSPTHLHCRTRKRVRNDRPDDQMVYENTLRWLFTAQQRQRHAPTPPADQDEDMEAEPAQEAVDPRQQTLLQFFRPIQPSSRACPPNNTSQIPVGFLPQRNIGSNSPSTPSDGSTIGLALQKADGDMDMDMDSGSDESVQESKQWTGGLGWM
ncbi:hypothetical protein AOCH_006034 [Aspergillus ochraceoroseus]|nr:hypothetical protein AOCH_006034 [Aspergillus ochraceoroseus]